MSDKIKLSPLLVFIKSNFSWKYNKNRIPPISPTVTTAIKEKREVDVFEDSANKNLKN